MAGDSVLRSLIQDMGKYAMFLFENSPTTEDEEPREFKGILYLTTALKTHILGCVSHLRDCNYVHAYDDYVAIENREKKLRDSMRMNLMESARTLPHMRFLRECTMYFITASILKEMGLDDAPEIVQDVMCLAFAATHHGDFLKLWGYVQPLEYY